MRQCATRGCKRPYKRQGLCNACFQRRKRRGTTAYVTPQERSELARSNGLASVAAMKERLGKVGYLEHMRGHQKHYLTGRATFAVQLARDKARETSHAN